MKRGAHRACSPIRVMLLSICGFYLNNRFLCISSSTLPAVFTFGFWVRRFSAGGRPGGRSFERPGLATRY